MPGLLCKHMGVLKYLYTEKLDFHGSVILYTLILIKKHEFYQLNVRKIQEEKTDMLSLQKKLIVIDDIRILGIRLELACN